MTLHEAVNTAEVILIEGDRGAGKNTLATFFASLSKTKYESAELVAIPKETYFKKQEIYNNMLKENKYEYTHIFFLFEQWRELKGKYGLSFLLNDIEKILDTTKVQILYFQRIDQIFDMNDQADTFQIVSEIARLALSRKVKLIVSLLKSSDNYLLVHNALLNFADLTLSIENDNDRRGRLVKIISSFYPSEHSTYMFKFGNNQFVLQEKHNETITDELKPVVTLERVDEKAFKAEISKKTTFNFVFVSQNQQIINWTAYLFGNLASLSLRQFRNISELSTEIWEQTDVIIYSSETIEEIFNFYHYAQEKNPLVKTFGWLLNGYIRADDKMKAHSYSSGELFGLGTRQTDYILALEKSLSVPFYSKTIEYRQQSSTVDSSSSFVDLIEEALRVRRIFSIFIFAYTVPFEDQNFETTFREEDVAYLDEVHHKIYLLFMNAQEQDSHILLKKLLSIKEDITFEKVIEAPALFGGHENLFDHTFLQKGSV
jgi:hypothetical protein